MSEKLPCPICYEDLIPRDGRSKITSGCCNYTFHYNCYLKYIESKTENKNNCPMCRSNFDKNDKYKYDIEILNGPSESIIIEIFPTRDYSITKIAVEVAFLLSYNETNIESIYYKLKLELNQSCLILKLDGKKLDNNYILPRNYTGKLSVYIEEEGWDDNIKKLELNGYKKLLNFFTENIDFNINYELGHTLKYCLELLTPIITRCDQITDYDTEDEILEVLIDAQKNGRSIFEALRYEFF